MQSQLCLVVLKSEALSAEQWASLLGVPPRAVREKCSPAFVMTDLFEFDSLPRIWRRKLDLLREEWRARSFTDILGPPCPSETRKRVNLRALSGGRWTHFSQFPPDAQEAAHRRMKVMRSYYDAIKRGFTILDATAHAQQSWREEFRHFKRQDGKPISPTMRDCSYKKIERLRKKVEEFGGPLAPVQAYLDGKACRHPGNRKQKRQG